ncbi:MAG: nitroreductase [candidate division Zixibacteria bacterium HGW-Zixibacteria-1]|nr:MAG: nitroreductase [candidate division Zixibacteria bacterium HGW-Zixibacteria-1]
MSGIIFFKTKMLEELRTFYIDDIGCTLWLEQADCLIFKHGNMLFGFCTRDSADREGMITFFFDTREQVDRFYDKFREIAFSQPSYNEKYEIYQFFAHDPEGRAIEFQCFENPVDRCLDAGRLLTTRRSIRKFQEAMIPEDILAQLFETCRFAPTSRNTQSYYFKTIRDRAILNQLAATRGSSSAPISNAPMAVAICSDPGLTKRVEQDGCIAAYHFLLAAWYFGLGTCWIAAMDRDDVKEWLNIPNDHYVATITPLGYPEQFPVAVPSRNERDYFIRE